MTTDQQQDREIEAVWQTPIGRMRGKVTGLGWRELRFPDLGEMTIPLVPQPAGIATVEWIRPDGQTSEQIPEPVRPLLDQLTDFLNDYFLGQTPQKTIPLDLSGLRPFDARVWQAAVRLPFGTTCTYGQLAAEIGCPGGARAVGGALGRNRLVIVVPCHRVVAAAMGARRLGGFTGGLKLKEYLLGLESRIAM